MGYFYVINPVLTGILILFTVAILSNNLSRNRIYPYCKVKIRKMSYMEKPLF